MNEQTNSSANLAPRRKGKVIIVVGSVLLLSVWTAIALPCLVPSHSAEREMAALRMVMQINEAQHQYSITKGHDKYTDLRTLTSESLIDVELAKSGFIFTSEPVEGGDKPMFDTTARPGSTGTWGVGNRSFYSNETFIVYDVEGGEPPMATPQNRVPEKGSPLQ